MIKNNKGFTLIELLAALVVLSILMVLALPQFTSLIDRNRDKVYINDALKMISQAEYKLRSNSTVIEKPDDGECIIFSLNYLDNNSFDNPPNKGEYLRYASFVVVKNNNGKLEYSALLVEEYKNSFKGVKLTKEADLNKSDAIKNVSPFTRDTLVYITDDISAKYASGSSENRTIGIDYINSYLGNNYVSAVDDRFVDEIPEKETDVDYLGTPKINSFVTISASGKEFNSLDMKMLVEAKDSDTPASDLTVYYNICTPNLKDTGSGACDYPDINNPSVSGFPYSTAGTSTFTSQSINLGRCSNASDYCADYGQEVTVFLIVADRDGNFVKKQKTYVIHTNEKPSIRTFEITRRDGDTANFLKAKAVVDVYDDIDEYGTLQYCITNDENAQYGDCTNFKPLNGPSFDYDFCTGDVFSAQCMPDGSINSVKIFIKDSKGLWDSKKYTYEAYKLNIETLVPQLTIASADSDVPTGEKSLKIRYNINIPFDSNSGIKEDDITYVLGLCESDSSCDTPSLLTQPISYKNIKEDIFQLYSNNSEPLYDGNQRNILVKVFINKYGLNTNPVTKIIRYVPYANQPPKKTADTNDEFISQTDTQFANHNSPATGTYNTIYKFFANDDIDKDDFWTCFSEDSSYCTFNTREEFESKFSKYSENNNFTFTPTSESFPYDGSSKTLYITMCDRYYLTPNMNSCRTISKDYTVYNNKAPKIESCQIESTSEEYNSYETYLTLKLSDDLENVKFLNVTLSDDTNTWTGTYADIFGDDQKVGYNFANREFDGQTRTLNVKVEDSYGAVVEQSFTYDVSLNHSPVVDTFRIERTEDVWNGNFPVTSDMAKGSYDAKVILNLEDSDVWDEGEIKYCISEIPFSDDDEDNGDTPPSTEPCSEESDYISYTEATEILYSFNRPVSRLYESQDSRTLYLKVRDSLDDIVKTSTVYSIYENQGPKATSVPVIKPDYSSITSDDIKKDGIKVNTVTVTSDFIDDFDDQSNLTVRLGYRKTGQSDFTYTAEQSYRDILSFTIGGSPFVYDGSTYELVIEAKDTYGKYTNTPAITQYTVYNNGDPQIINTMFKNECKNVYTDLTNDDGTATQGDSECLEDNSINESKFHIIAYVKDYFDTYKICVSESSSTCTDYTSANYSGDSPTVGNSSNVYTLTNSNYTGDTPTTVYIYIKDSAGHVTKEALSYAVYKACQNEDEMVETNITYTPVDASAAVSPIKCGGECYKASGDESIPDRQFQYTRHFDLMDPHITGRICKPNQSATETLYCSYETCFYNASSQPTYWLIGDNVNTDKNSSGTTITYTYSGDIAELENKTFTKYHKVYKLESREVNGHIGYYLVLKDSLKIPDAITGMSNYNYRDYFKFDQNDDQSYLVFDD